MATVTFSPPGPANPPLCAAEVHEADPWADPTCRSISSSPAYRDWSALLVLADRLNDLGRPDLERACRWMETRRLWPDQGYRPDPIDSYRNVFQWLWWRSGCVTVREASPAKRDAIVGAALPAELFFAGALSPSFGRMAAARFRCFPAAVEYVARGLSKLDRILNPARPPSLFEGVA